MCHLTASPRGLTSKGETGSVRDGTVSGHNVSRKKMAVCSRDSRLKILKETRTKWLHAF
jgi:hypothetical protein